MLALVTLQYPGFMEQLAKEKYDAAFTEPVCFCGYGKHRIDAYILLI